MITLGGVVVLGAVVCDGRDVSDHEGEPPAADGAREALSDAEIARLEEKHAEVEALAPGEWGRLGELEAAHAPEDAWTVPEAIERCAGGDEICAVRGRVSLVCEDRDCWLALGGGGDGERARLSSGEALIPYNIAGAEAVVEGRMMEREIDDDARQRVVDPGSGPPGLGEAPRVAPAVAAARYEVEARALKIRFPEDGGGAN